MIATPVYDSLTTQTPMPELTVDLDFHWEAPHPARGVVSAPKPGAKPVGRRKKARR